MAKIKLRRDTAANWSNPLINPVLASGEPGYETDTGKLKIGDGSTAWNSLPYFDDQEMILSAVTQNIVPNADNTYDLGAPDKQWRHVYTAGGSIYIDDIKLSNNDGQLVVQQVTDPGQETEAPVPNTPGSVTTDRLVNGENEFSLDAQGVVRLNDVEFSVAGPTGPQGNTGPAGPTGPSGEAGTPTISNTRKGWINLVGDKPNEYDSIWFESVTVNNEFAYVVGGDQYVDGSGDLTKIYKFNLETGEQVWVKEIVAGRDATFDLTITSEVITVTNIVQGGQGYIVGEELYFNGSIWGGNSVTNRVTVVVDTVDEGGGILTASIKPGYNLTGVGDIAVTGQQADNNNARGQGTNIAYDAYIDKLVIVSYYISGQGDADYDNNYTWANVFVVDPVTAVIDQTLTLSTEGDIYPNSLKLSNTSGGIVVVGEKYGEFRQFGTLTLLQGYNGYFDILKSEVDEEHYPGSPYDNYSDFWVSGTGISTVDNVDNVNYYENLNTTVRQGSGATFDVVINTTSVYDAVNIASGGTNYLPGHKILIPGTSLEGISPTNDITITVTSVTEGGVIDGISFVAGSYGNAQAAPYTYSAVSGTNYQTGSGARFTGYVNEVTGVFTVNFIPNGGSNYVEGDILTVPGTSFANGASPANDLTAVVTGLNTGAVIGINSNDLSGTAPTDAIRVFVSGVDFTAEGGSWSMKQNLGGEAFVWTPNWSNAIGGPSGDRFYDVCWSQDGASIFAVGRGRYETTYDQALVVKFNAATGAVIWGKDIKFSQATSANREARSVCNVPGSTDIMVAGMWNPGNEEVILTRITEAGVAVWQKTYLFNDDGSNIDLDYEIKIQPISQDEVLVSVESSTPIHGRGLGYLKVNLATGAVVDSRVLSSDSNGNYNFYDTPTPNFAAQYLGEDGELYTVMAGYTYVPTDNYYNALLVKLPVDSGYKNLQEGEYVSLGEHILGKYNWDVTTVTPAFDSFAPLEHLNTIDSDVNQRGYTTRIPEALLKVFRFDITDDSLGYLEFGDGSKQSFATNVIPQIPASNDYYLTEQDSGKHIFFEDESGEVFIPHWTVKDLPVGFTFTIVNTTGNDCYVTCEGGEIGNRGRMKLAGRNLDTSYIGIPDSGSGSMVTFLKVKSGYSMVNTDYDGYYNDVWMVSGPSDIYDND